MYACVCFSLLIEMNEGRFFFVALSKMKIGFLGAGRMSQALVRSLIERKVVTSKDQIIASDIDENQRKMVTVCYLSTIRKSLFVFLSDDSRNYRSLRRKIMNE